MPGLDCHVASRLAMTEEAAMLAKRPQIRYSNQVVITRASGGVVHLAGRQADTALENLSYYDVREW